MKFAGAIFLSVAVAQYSQVPSQINARDQCLFNCNGVNSCQLGCDSLIGSPVRQEISSRDQCLLGCAGDQACSLRCDNVILQNTTAIVQQPMSDRDICLINCKGDPNCQLACDKLTNQATEDATNFNNCITKCNSGQSSQYDQSALLACQGLCNVTIPTTSYSSVAYSTTYAYSSNTTQNGTRSGPLSSSSPAYSTNSMYYSTTSPSQTSFGYSLIPPQALVLAGVVASISLI